MPRSAFRYNRRDDLARDAPPFVDSGDVEAIFIDRRIQRLLYDYAVSKHVSQAWLSKAFRFAGGGFLRLFARPREDFLVDLLGERVDLRDHLIHFGLSGKADRFAAAHSGAARSRLDPAFVARSDQYRSRRL